MENSPLWKPLYRHEVQRLVEAPPVLPKTHPPIEALRLWMYRPARYGLTKAGLGAGAPGVPRPSRTKLPGAGRRRWTQFERPVTES